MFYYTLLATKHTAPYMWYYAICCVMNEICQQPSRSLLSTWTNGTGSGRSTSYYLTDRVGTCLCVLGCRVRVVHSFAFSHPPGWCITCMVSGEVK